MATKDIVAQNLRILRDLKALSQLELAEQVGVSRRTIARLEAAEIADPGIDQIRALARVLGVTVDMLAESRLTAVRIPVPHELKRVLESEDGARVLARMVRDAQS